MSPKTIRDFALYLSENVQEWTSNPDICKLSEEWLVEYEKREEATKCFESQVFKDAKEVASKLLFDALSVYEDPVLTIEYDQLGYRNEEVKIHQRLISIQNDLFLHLKRFPNFDEIKKILGPDPKALHKNCKECERYRLDSFLKSLNGLKEMIDVLAYHRKGAVIYNKGKYTELHNKYLSKIDTLSDEEKEQARTEILEVDNKLKEAITAKVRQSLKEAFEKEEESNEDAGISEH